MKTFLSIALLTALLAPVGASADETRMKAECYERSNLLYSLATDYGERLEQTRKVGATGLLESFTSDEGTWTIVYSNDEGLSCVLASGEGLEAHNGKDGKQKVELGA